MMYEKMMSVHDHEQGDGAGEHANGTSLGRADTYGAGLQRERAGLRMLAAARVAYKLAVATLRCTPTCRSP